jgi:hypothetical protein
MYRSKVLDDLGCKYRSKDTKATLVAELMTMEARAKARAQLAR